MFKSTREPFSHRNASTTEKSDVKEAPTTCDLELIAAPVLLSVPAMVPRSVIAP